MQINLPQKTSSVRSADTPTRLRIEYNVNSPKLATKTKGIKISDLDDYDEDSKQPVPDFITQVAQSPVEEEELPDNLEQSSCFCSTACFFGVGKSKRGRTSESAKKYATTTASFERVELRTEKRASIVRTNTPERKSSLQNSALQLATIPTGADEECYIPEIEDSSEEVDQGSPWMEDRKVVLVTDDESSSSGAFSGLLGPKLKKHRGMKCLVLDLDETLVHSSFKPVRDADYIVPVEIDRIVYKVYVRKRPFVDEFLIECGKHYEVVVFTASLSKYANPLLDMLDVNNVVTHRLFRESCVFYGQSYVKDLSKLGRRMEDVIIVDNSSVSYAFQPNNAIPITSWYNDTKDLELRDLLPVLQTTLKEIDDVRDLLDANKSYKWICSQAAETITTSI